MILPERLLEALRLRGLSQAAVARAAGLSSTMINKLARGEARESAHIYAIAKALDVTPEYLSGDTDEFGEELPRNPSLEVSLKELGLVPVRELDMTLGMGATYLDVPVTEKIRHFPIEFLRLYTRASPDQLFFAQGMGDSMEPTLRDSDLLLIDCSQKSLNISEKIWAIAFAGVGAIKRLRPLPSGGIEMMSDNPNVTNAVAFDDEMQIIGRVVAVVRKT